MCQNFWYTPLKKRRKNSMELFDTSRKISDRQFGSGENDWRIFFFFLNDKMLYRRKLSLFCFIKESHWSKGNFFTRRDQEGFSVLFYFQIKLVMTNQHQHISFWVLVDRQRFPVMSSLLFWLLGAASKYWSSSLDLTKNHVSCMCFEWKLTGANSSNAMEFTTTLLYLK